MAIETWYVMEDGSVGDPRDILTGADGKLRHKDGRAVAMRGDAPSSRGGVDPEKERARAAKLKVEPKTEAKAEVKAEPKAGPVKAKVDEKLFERDWTKPRNDREMKPEGRQSYKTR